jgi:ABC-type transport system involved in multi-copper enzyme maturation permease subunit
MLKALLGLLKPNSGTIRVLDLDVATLGLEVRARIGYMPENDAQIPGMNAVSFVAYCGELSGLSAADAMQRAHEVLYYVGLGEARYRNVETYSNGMKQRIKLAQALVHDPDLLLLGWIPCIVRGVLIYAATNFPQASFFAVSTRTFRDFLDQQELFVFFITVYAGSGLIADDIRANALQLYLSRPVTRTQYAAGKLATLMAALAMVTWVPAMLLLMLEPLFAGNTTFVRANLSLIPAIGLFSLVEIVVASFTMLALSSLSKSRWFVAVMYAGLAFFTQSIFAATRIASQGTSFAWIGLFANLAQVGDVIFRLSPRFDTPPIVSAMVLAALVAVSAAVLKARIRAIEVVT